jgi:hypothetical protein
MSGIGSIGALLVGAAAFALATPAIACALGEAPPAGRMPRVVIGVAIAASLLFVIAAIGAGMYAAGFAVVGLLLAAAELAAAAAIWLARGRPADGDDNGGWSVARPEVPPKPSVPDECWRLWEEQFTSPVPARPRALVRH